MVQKKSKYSLVEVDTARLGNLTENRVGLDGPRSSKAAALKYDILSKYWCVVIYVMANEAQLKSLAQQLMDTKKKAITAAKNGDEQSVANHQKEVQRKEKQAREVKGDLAQKAAQADSDPIGDPDLNDPTEPHKPNKLATKSSTYDEFVNR